MFRFRTIGQDSYFLFTAGATESRNPNNQVTINKFDCRSLEISAEHPKTPPELDMWR